MLLGRLQADIFLGAGSIARQGFNLFMLLLLLQV
jgi:hypothetical protein